MQQAQIILSGISNEQLLDGIETTVRNVFEKYILGLQKTESATELITRKEAAQIYGVSLPTLHEWTKKGIIPAQRIGTRIRYKRADVYASLKDVETLKYKRA